MKKLHISHIADTDGIMPVILSKLVFKELDYILADVAEVDDIVLDVIHNKMDQYEFIYITDLCITEKVAEEIAKDDALKNKILVFDHHHSRLSMNQYSFINVIDIDKKGIKQCGTSLYYQFLLENYDIEILHNKAVSEMVELVRSLDTWDWFKDHNEEAKWLGNLLSIYGKEYFIKYFYQYILEHNTFHLDEKQKYILEIEDIRIANYAKEKEKELIPFTIDGYHVGVVFAESHRSALGGIFAEKFKHVYDFIIIINISRGISYRGCKNIDLGAFASIYGGGGHVNAAGSSLPQGIKEKILKKTFEKGEVLHEN